jgi:queuine tRNA-ribosyltransferase
MVFTILHEDGLARVGKLHTSHGAVLTPFFMPVASKGSVKAMAGDAIDSLGYEALISNSFLLSLSPGVDIIEKFGGIHSFMNFHKTIFTDSGGFQVLSKDFLVKKSIDGAIFKDKWGKKHSYTPEIAMENQLRMGSDVAMTLDDVAHYGLDGKAYVDAIKRTHEWAKRSLLFHKKMKAEQGSEQLLFGIAQGGTRDEYRRFSTHKINELDFDGVALGGLVIGESRTELIDMIAESVAHFDTHKVKYLMGLGSPPDVVRAVGLGIDCFDSIYPTSNARHGSMLTRQGRIAIKKVRYKEDEGPIEEGCDCLTCTKYSRAYLHHLLRHHELLGYTLATIHNLHFMNTLLKELRRAIQQGAYTEYAQTFLEDYFSGTESKEFSSNIRHRYMEKERLDQAKFYLDWKGE